jgi:hypothetical protein
LERLERKEFEVRKEEINKDGDGSDEIKKKNKQACERKR